MRMKLWTVGHGTRGLEELVALLQGHGVTTLADVRTVPRSRRNPQFNRDTLPDALAAHGIRYIHLPELGGLRRPRLDSINGAWRNASFRGYADYMQTSGFADGIETLMQRAAERPTAIMCAEAVPWRCHRSLVADALVARAVEVAHIMTPTRADRHSLREWARVQGMRVFYPGVTDRTE
jgi:uncharacterized protein (DUF488 family)